MGKAANVIAMLIALGVAYELGKREGAREMFFTYTEAVVDAKISGKTDDLYKKWKESCDD